MNLVPVADVPPQNVDPWEATLRRVLNDRQHFEELSARSREAALQYLTNLSVEPFETFLEEVLRNPKKARMSEEKKKLLALKLRQRAKPAWLSGIEDRTPGRPLLFCFPYAGGGTNLYRGWRDRLSEIATVIAIRLPGRESRLDEPPYERMDALIDALAAIQLDTSFVFFGHSMGAAIAFELAQRLRDEGKTLPRALYVSAARAPQFRLHHQPGPEPSEEALLEELKRLGGMPREILENQELMRLALPALRADARLYRNYIYKPGEPFDFPIFAYGGSDDPNVRPEHLEAWRKQTTGDFRRREFPGGHFFIQSAPEFLDVLADDVSTAPSGRGSEKRFVTEPRPKGAV
jgi:medium-chain acyl-[acyl-carrier-protein] hydrolase